MTSLPAQRLFSPHVFTSESFLHSPLQKASRLPFSAPVPSSVPWEAQTQQRGSTSVSSGGGSWPSASQCRCPCRAQWVLETPLMTEAGRKGKVTRGEKGGSQRDEAMWGHRYRPKTPRPRPEGALGRGKSLSEARDHGFPSVVAAAS